MEPVAGEAKKDPDESEADGALEKKDSASSGPKHIRMWLLQTKYVCR